MRFFVIIFGLLLLGSVVGIQESFADEKSWWLGENLKQGDYFEYSLCHMDYDHCEEIRMNIWIGGDIQVGSETKWLAKVVVYEGNKIIKGEMEFGKITAVPIGSTENLRVYSTIFKNSISWLSAYTTSDENIYGTTDFSKNSFQRICDPGCPQLTPMGLEVITTPAGTFDAEVISWGGMSGHASNIWVVDDFPFPVKASVFVFSPIDDVEKKYKFVLLDYKENIPENPFLEEIELLIIHPPPKKQIQNGVLSNDVICKDGLELIFKPNNSPICVKPSTAVKLTERIGWEILTLNQPVNGKDSPCEEGYYLAGDICDKMPPGYVEARNECEMGVDSMEAAGVDQDYNAELEKCR